MCSILQRNDAACTDPNFLGLYYDTNNKQVVTAGCTNGPAPGGVDAIQSMTGTSSGGNPQLIVTSTNGTTGVVDLPEQCPPHFASESDAIVAGMSGSAVQFYQDPTSGKCFTTPASTPCSLQYFDALPLATGTQFCSVNPVPTEWANRVGVSEVQRFNDGMTVTSSVNDGDFSSTPWNTTGDFSLFYLNRGTLDKMDPYPPTAPALAPFNLAPGTTTRTFTFSPPITDPVLNLQSVGQPNLGSTFRFSTRYCIRYVGNWSEVFFGTPSVSKYVFPNDRELICEEGYLTAVFPGTFSTISLINEAGGGDTGSYAWGRTTSSMSYSTGVVSSDGTTVTFGAVVDPVGNALLGPCSTVIDKNKNIYKPNSSGGYDLVSPGN